MISAGSVGAAFLLGVSTLLPVINPLSGGMFFATMAKNITDADRAFMSLRIAVYSLCVLFVCLSVGQIVLSFFGISVGALRVAGGGILLMAGWTTLNSPSDDDANKPTESPSRVKLKSMAFYPFTLPLTTGPGAISVSVALGTSVDRSLESIAGMALAVLATVLSIWASYRYSDRLNKAFGPVGADALTRLLAFILICMGVSIAWQGFSELWTTLNLQLHQTLQAASTAGH